EERPHRLAVSPRQPARMDAHPQLVLQQPARDERLIPDLRRRFSILGQRGGGVEVDHRSPRSSSISRRSCRSFATGGAAAGREGDSSAGVIHPRRTASARSASGTRGARAPLGGTSSATTRSRSAMSTVSPWLARRTYSLSFFFRVLRPTTRM